MKALTIFEPWASLIASGQKSIETRSWRTHYRGELFIHAGKKKITLKEYPALAKVIQEQELPLHHGNLICRANLVDCIYMDETFIHEISLNSKEFLFGFYEIGRYAWVFEEVEKLPTPIPAKGNRSLWNCQDYLTASFR